MDVREFQLIKELEKRIEIWKKDEKISYENFINDIEKQNAICYNIMICIQCLIDLENIIIEKKGYEIASTYAEIFEILKRHKIIKNSLAKELSFLARFRNVLAHVYWSIDYKKVYNVLKTKRKILEKSMKIFKGVFK